MWHIVVYSGPVEERRRRCRGAFTHEPTIFEVNRLLRTLAPIKRLEIARRTPASEPEPVRTEPFTFQQTLEGETTAVPA